LRATLARKISNSSFVFSAFSVVMSWSAPVYAIVGDAYFEGDAKDEAFRRVRYAHR
jgi:hypothetical protein